MIRIIALLLTTTIGTLCVQPATPSSLCNISLADNDLVYDHHNGQTFKLFARQTTQCQSTCSVVDSVLINGTCSPTQCCTNSFAQSFFDCFVCVARVSAQADYYHTKAQRILDDLIIACAARGFLVNQLIFPGQNPDRTLSSFFLGPTQPGNSVHVQPTPEPPAFSILPISPTLGISSSIQSSTTTPSLAKMTSTPRNVETASSLTSTVQTSGACRLTSVNINVLGLLVVAVLAVALESP